MRNFRFVVPLLALSTFGCGLAQTEIVGIGHKLSSTMSREEAVKAFANSDVSNWYTRQLFNKEVNEIRHQNAKSARRSVLNIPSPINLGILPTTGDSNYHVQYTLGNLPISATAEGEPGFLNGVGYFVATDGKVYTYSLGSGSAPSYTSY